MTLPPIFKTYNPKDWYWFVGGDTTRVFSSARGDYFPAATDVAFLAWSADGMPPTNIDTEANLGQVLAPFQARPTTPAVLDGYTGSLADTAINDVQFKILFNHENRIRAIERALGLNGSPPNVTPAQARAAVKALM